MTNRLLLLPLLLGLHLPLVQSGTNCSTTDTTKNCVDGLFFPIWKPYFELTFYDRLLRGTIYFVAIIYCFLGVSIVADRFMSSIEVITSKERTIIVKRPGLESVLVTVRIWNDTVSNLTLMALGSSAPEILLSIIEVLGKGFEAGELGPNTIVGSAAFNLFMIIAICVWVVPSSEVRRQKHLDVFFVTATWSIFAYIWLYLILAVITPNIIDVWEGLLTFSFFPLTVFTAWVADIKILQTKFLPRRYRRSSKGMITTEEGEQVQMTPVDGIQHEFNANQFPSIDFVRQSRPSISIADMALKAFEDHRHEFIAIMREIRKKNPQLGVDELQKLAEYEMINRGPKSRAFYRVQATRRMVGGGDLVRRKIDKEHYKSSETLVSIQDISQMQQGPCRVFFDPAHYTVLENVGTIAVMVSREGGPDHLTVIADYFTEDGSANANSDYMPVKGTLTFQPDERHHQISIEIIDDDVFEEDEHFYLHLTNLRVRLGDGPIVDEHADGITTPMALLDLTPTATIMILDDDHAGVFTFEHSNYKVIETCGQLNLKVQRNSGVRGRVLIPFRTIEGTAKGDKDFQLKEGQLVFENNQTEALIDIGIVDTEEYERKSFFFVEFYEPIWVKNLSDLKKIQGRILKRLERKRVSSFGSEGGPKTTSSKLLPRGRIGSSFADFNLNNFGSRGEFDRESLKHLTDDQLEVAELGKPRLGDICRCKITITESKEFQNVVDRLIKTANTSIMLSTSSWREQFIEALNVISENVEEEKMGEDDREPPKDINSPSCKDYATHFICVPWKLIFSLIPPTDYLGGWACFVVSILGIGLLTAILGDLASHFGCWLGLKDAVTAITFVALGTSVPDTFASRTAAIQDKYADSSIGNVTGSNGVNVFLGIGIAWTLAASYHWFIGDQFRVKSGTLAFSVTIFCIGAVLCIVVIVARRHPAIGGELGGPFKFKLTTTCFFVLLWVLYVLFSALESYCVISGF